MATAIKPQDVVRILTEKLPLVQAKDDSIERDALYIGTVVVAVRGNKVLLKLGAGADLWFDADALTIELMPPLEQP